MDTIELWVPGGVAGGAAVCATYAVLFVGLLYIWKDGLRANREDEAVIKRRLISVTIATTICFIITRTFYVGNSWRDFLAIVGIRTPGLLAATIIPLSLFMLLFLGPIGCLYVDPSFSIATDLLPRFRKWSGIRDLVAGPLAEEIVFRAFALPILLASGMSPWAASLYAPFVFGLAHAHHIIHHLNERNASLKQVIFRILFQLFYTTLFGSLVAYVYIRTGHLIGCFLTHSFCNFMGFPDFNAIQESRHPKLLWSFFVIGLVGFIVLIEPLTDPAIYSSPFAAFYAPAPRHWLLQLLW